ncbi:Riboflavin kinase-like protein [Hapsidospora chrysogenum ATCC 11550]|uniref:Riboflavin kinase n=1 Tax=Hapsidospora chrysogenum (strain ATCC 11550 / CBS 779.69 / DSM 880 / IAM 14645 / JCM 23072 / IMI 49137) TaxID=857340 RepID=A0A086TAJ6_HAPC1|nr:Riboflavin kinase-like protein [Hapsidospora chrysogenum ATCC 11550]
MSAGRPSIVGDDAGPSPPYPLKMEGKVISGFGRGSKEASHPIPDAHGLGIPTANLPVDESTTPWIADAKSGVYFGYASLSHPPTPTTTSPSPDSSSHPPTASFRIFPMVMSIGYNPFYKNTIRSAEVHILHRFDADFYGSHMRLLILGYVREELDYTTLEALVADINFDCEVARKSLARKGWAPRKGVVVKDGEGNGGEVADVDGTLDVDWLVTPL